MPCAPALHGVIQQVEMKIATSFQEMGEIALTWQPGWKVECAHGVSKAQGVDVYKALQCKTLCKDVWSLYWNIAQTPRLGILWWIMAQPILHGKWKAFFRTASMNFKKKWQTKAVRFPLKQPRSLTWTGDILQRLIPLQMIHGDHRQQRLEARLKIDMTFNQDFGARNNFRQG